MVENSAYTADGNLIVVCAASELKDLSITSITVSVADVKGDGDWWASYDNGGSEWVSMKDGWDDSIGGYKTTITDSSTISYFKENGIKIGMASGLTAKITVSVSVTKSEGTGDDDGSETGNTDNTPPTGGSTGNTGETESSGSTGTESSGGKDDDSTGGEKDKTEESKEFTFSYEASKISENTASITITVTNITGTTTGDWWFWANTDGGDGDKIGWKSDSDAETIYEVTITDATKIAYLKENGLKITGSAGLNADVTVTQSATINNEESTDEPKEFYRFMEAEKILETANSITITVTDVTSTTSEEWWFWANTDGGKGDDIKWESKSEDGKDVYKLTITDTTKIAYIKENGLEIKGAKGLSAIVEINCKV